MMDAFWNLKLWQMLLLSYGLLALFAIMVGALIEMTYVIIGMIKRGEIWPED